MAKLKSRLMDYVKESDAVVKQSLEQTGDKVLTLIHERVPIDTGDLKRSYMKEVSETNQLLVGSNQFRGVYARPYPTFYAPFVEFHGRNTPQPHFVPAWIQTERIFTAEVISRLQKL